MYCPQCNYPVPSKAEKCPNCEHVFKKASPPNEEMFNHESETRLPDSREEAKAQDTTGNSLNKKVLWGTIFVLAPFTALLFSVLSYLTRDIQSVQNFMTMAAAFLMFLSLVLVPAALIMSFIGYREIRKAPEKSSGKVLAITVMVFSLLIMVSGPIYAYYIYSNLDTIKEQVVDKTIEQIEDGIRVKESLNRDSGETNSFGTYFPEMLDNAPANSKSSAENAFFTEVITPNGFPFGGWEKGENVNTYSVLNDSTEYVYDPEKGTFSIKEK